MAKILSILVCLIAFLTVQLYAGDVVIIQDDFEGDTLGGGPGGADVGDVYYYGAGSQVIVNEFGSQALESTDTVTDGGFAVQYMPLTSPEIFEATWDFMILEDSAGSGSYVASQGMTVHSASGNIVNNIRWLEDGSLQFCGTLTGFTWSTNTAYSLRYRIDCGVDKAWLWIDGAQIVDALPLNDDCTTLFDFSHGSYYPSTVRQRIDNIRVVDHTMIFADGFEDGSADAWSTGL